jgi:hypothetical protein
MKLLPAISGLRLPPFLKKIGLNRLSHATATAFGCPAPSLKGLSFKEGLRIYALFTRQAVQKGAFSKEELPAVQARLYGSSYRWGRRFRRVLHITALAEVMALSRILYRALEIDFEGTSQGEITIRRCFFSNFYSPEVCGAISDLDQGLLAGLSGGGRLQFYQRITEGGKCCKACLFLKEKSQ